MRQLCAFILLATLVSAGSAQIKVTVNGEPVFFSGTGPQQIGGRTLVPLRGVMEKIGAMVGWDGPTRTVTAQRGNIDLRMRLGDPTATVNGRTVTLDVPAQQINGVTMVPLRFMGETLGAEIKWDGATQTIAITMADSGGGNTGGGNDTGGGNTGGGNVPITIGSFSHTGTGWVHKGQSVSFSLTGTPKAIATVTISGVEGAIQLNESQPGQYTGVWTPGDGINIQGTSVLCSLRIGTSEKLIQSGTSLSVDTLAPSVKAFTPESGSSVEISRPDISGVFDDAGAGIDASSVRIKVNNVDVTSKATINSNLFLYTPAANLPNGMSTVAVSFSDKAGNPGMFQGTFMVASASNASVKSFVHTARYYAQVGKTIGFKMEAEPGSKVTVNLGSIIKDLPLKEGPSGVYQGTYTVRAIDKFNNSPVTAKVVLKNGTSFNVEAPNRIPKTIDAGVAFGPATITSHKDGGTASDPLVLKGKSLAKTKVQIRVTYATTVLNTLRVNGTLSDQTVDVDSNGDWTSSAISLSTGVGGKKTEYTVTVTSINTDGTKATATVIKLK